MKKTKSTMLLAALSAATLALASCGTDSGSTTNVADGNSASADSDTVTIVASTQIWGDVAEAVVPDADVSSIIVGGNIDPHHFEPAAGDLAVAEQADIVVAGGGGYDAWLYMAVDHDKVVHALPLIDHDHAHDHDHDHDHGDEHADEAHDEHDHDHGHDHDHDHSAEGPIESIDGNEHIWYDTDAVTFVAEEIATAAKEINPDIDADASNVAAAMAELSERIAELPGVNVAQTETIGDYIIDDSDMTDITPEGYRRAMLNHSEPAAADLAEFLDVIESGDVDLLIFNPNTANDMTDSIRSAAEAHNVTIIEILETPPEGTNFLDYFEQIIAEMESVQ